MQFVTGTLDFTSISGVNRQFKGVGSELQTSLYLIEGRFFRMNLFIASRVMTWAGQNVVESEYDDIQSFSVAPGLEVHLGPLSVRAATQRINANAYFISSSSMGKQITMDAPHLGADLNFKFGSLGVGIGTVQSQFKVSGEKLGLASDSIYKEQTYSINLIYYMNMTPGRFFKGLFK